MKVNKVKVKDEWIETGWVEAVRKITKVLSYFKTNQTSMEFSTKIIFGVLRLFSGLISCNQLYHRFSQRECEASEILLFYSKLPLTVTKHVTWKPFDGIKFDYTKSFFSSKYLFDHSTVDIFLLWSQVVWQFQVFWMIASEVIL